MLLNITDVAATATDPYPVLKIVYDKGWLYRGHRAMPWCARCGTALAEQKPILVHRDEHFRAQWHMFSCAVTPLSPRHSQHELVNPQGGVALTAGANDSLAIVVGSGPCVSVVPAPSML